MLNPMTDEMIVSELKPKQSKSNKRNKLMKSTQTSFSTKSSSKIRDKKKNTVLNIIVPAEVFFTDPNFSLYCMEKNNNKMEGYVLINVINLMTRPQKIRMDPLVLKIHSVNNLPIDVLQKHGYEKCFLDNESIPKSIQY